MFCDCLLVCFVVDILVGFMVMVFTGDGYLDGLALKLIVGFLM